MFNSAGWSCGPPACFSKASLWQRHLLHLAVGRYFCELVGVNPHLNFNSRGSVSGENARTRRYGSHRPICLLAKWLLKFKAGSLIKADLAALGKSKRILDHKPLNYHLSNFFDRWILRHNSCTTFLLESLNARKSRLRARISTNDWDQRLSSARGAIKYWIRSQENPPLSKSRLL